MNTTGLIAQWSMSGARRDLSGRFRSVGDLRETLSALERDPGEPPLDPLLVRRHDEAEWRPLLLAVREANERRR
jgi:hypothetical protein